MGRRLAVTFLSFVGVLALAAGPAFAQVTTCTVATDKSEYAPGETVLVTGVGPAGAARPSR